MKETPIKPTRPAKRMSEEDRSYYLKIHEEKQRWYALPAEQRKDITTARREKRKQANLKYAEELAKHRRELRNELP